MKPMNEQRNHRAYSAPTMAVVALKPAVRLLGTSGADVVMGLDDDVKTVYEDDVW